MPDIDTLSTARIPNEQRPPDQRQPLDQPAPIDLAWLARHDDLLKIARKNLARAIELLSFRDGTRPQIVRGGATIALDHCRQALQAIDTAQIPFDPPYAPKRGKGPTENG